MLALNQSDALAITLLVVLALSFGCVLLLLLSICQRTGSRDVEVDRLLDEVSEEDKDPEPETAGAAEKEPPREPWERESDWWKKG